MRPLNATATRRPRYCCKGGGRGEGGNNRARNTARVQATRQANAAAEARQAQFEREQPARQAQFQAAVDRLNERNLRTLERALNTGSFAQARRLINQVNPERRRQRVGDIQLGQDIQDILRARGRLR